MFLKIVMVYICLCVLSVFGKYSCYWSARCPYQLYSSKTPYDTVRGDVRDIHAPNCEAVSLWHLQRHGNRNPGTSTMEEMKGIFRLRDEIVQSYEAGKSQLCAQDIEEFKKFQWNSTVEDSTSFLTGQGYEEIYQIASRIRQRFPELLHGDEQDYYFRPTQEQRTVASGMAFIHGLSDGSNLTNLLLSDPEEKQDIIRGYEDCDRYQNEVKNGETLKDQLAAYDTSPAYVEIRDKLQERLGLNTILKEEDVYSFYEICRFYRTWSMVKSSPWCSVFTEEELEILEYRDDVRHYWRNGYGSWVNSHIGGPALKDLFENFEAVVNGGQKKVTGYFTHDTMMEMVFSALGLFNDHKPINGGLIDDNRVWRTSFMSSFSTNLMAVLYKCTESFSPVFRVQILVNEKEVDICQPPGCTWQEFTNIFLRYNDSNFDFCDMKSIVEFPEPGNSGSVVYTSGFIVLAAVVRLLLDQFISL